MVWVVGIGIFLFLLFAFPRQIGGLILLLLLVAAGVWLYFDLEQKSREKDLKSIGATATVGDGCNDRDFPIAVIFQNWAKKDTEQISFYLSAKRPGYSNDVYFAYMTSDKIIPPLGVYRSCWKIDRYSVKGGSFEQFDPVALTWSVKISSVRFAH